MAFATIAASNGGGGTSTTTPTTTVPAGVQANDIIVFVLSSSATSTTVTLDTSTAGTWTTLKDEMTSQRRPVIFYKVANGTESSATLTHTFGTAGGYKWIGFLIRGANSSQIQVSTTASATSASPDPASLTTTWGTADNLWIEVGILTSTNTITTASTGFTGLTNQGGNSTNLTIGWAYNQNSVGTYDPDAMVASASTGWNTHLLAFGPAIVGLGITSVTPSAFDSGITGIVIAGNNFGASQGSSTVDIGGVAQTVTAWSNTSITITSARGSNSMGAGQLNVTIR